MTEQASHIVDTAAPDIETCISRAQARHAEARAVKPVSMARLLAERAREALVRALDWFIGHIGGPGMKMA